MRMHGSDRSHALNLRVGDVVEVRSEREILDTLDGKGTLEALPFMPEMLKYCGKRFKVYRRADKTCDTVEKTGLRRLKNTVHLGGLRCDGEAHGGCQAGCLLFWKEAWLKRIRPDFLNEAGIQNAESPKGTDLAPPADETGACTLATLLRTTRVATNPPSPGEDTFSCQATELRKFTSSLAWWDLFQYWRDLKSGNIGIGELLRAAAIELFNQFQELRRGGKYPYIAGKLMKTPSGVLDLRPGELVQVKSKDEILETLDTEEKNRGLSFDREMVKYCGGKYRVLRRVERLINERTGKMMKMNSDCIILDDVICTADYHGFCPRSIYPYWREIWLKRVE